MSDYRIGDVLVPNGTSKGKPTFESATIVDKVGGMWVLEGVERRSGEVVRRERWVEILDRYYTKVPTRRFKVGDIVTWGGRHFWLQISEVTATEYIGKRYGYVEPRLGGVLDVANNSEGDSVQHFDHADIENNSPVLYTPKENPTTMRDFNRSSVGTYTPTPFQVDLPSTPTTPRPDGGYGYDGLVKDTVTLVHIGEGGYVRQAKSKDAKVALLLAAEGGTMLSFVPGRWSSDTFFINDRSKALEHLGFRKVQPASTRRAVDGSEWVAA